MAERNRRDVQRPRAFWGMVAVSTLIGLLAAAALWLRA